MPTERLWQLRQCFGANGNLFDGPGTARSFPDPAGWLSSTGDGAVSLIEYTVRGYQSTSWFSTTPGMPSTSRVCPATLTLPRNSPTGCRKWLRTNPRFKDSR